MKGAPTPTHATRKHSREWFAAKVKAVADRIDTYPDHIKAGMVWASATLPTPPATTQEPSHE